MNQTINYLIYIFQLNLLDELIVIKEFLLVLMVFEQDFHHLLLNYLEILILIVDVGMMNLLFY